MFNLLGFLNMTSKILAGAGIVTAGLGLKNKIMRGDN
jgi:hypothetical protein